MRHSNINAAHRFSTFAFSAFIVSLILLSLTNGACRQTTQTGGAGNTNAPAGSSPDAAEDTSATPPFATKEPERYQALMVVTSDLGEQASALSGIANLTNMEMLVARDGERRRTDYEMTGRMKMSYLQLPAGQYVMLESKKVYAEIKQNEAGGAAADPSKMVAPDFSPDKLINEARAGARYEKLGTEDVNGRTATKYRATMTGQTGAAKNIKTETLLWIDESLGMPIKTVTTSTGDAAHGAKFMMEMRDIKQDVDASLFELPSDYRKVETKELYAMMLPKMTGGLSEIKEALMKSKKK